MQESTAHQHHRPRSSSMASLQHRAAKATCGLISRPSQPQDHQDHQEPHPPPSTMPYQPPGLSPPPQDPTPQPSTLPRRRTSLRERFWSVNSANAVKEADRERRQREGHHHTGSASHGAMAAGRIPEAQEAYTPRHAAVDFSAHMAGREAYEGQYERERERYEGDDYALFVERSEIAHDAEATKALVGRTKSQKRRSLGRRFAEYVKPVRQE